MPNAAKFSMPDKAHNQPAQSLSNKSQPNQGQRASLKIMKILLREALYSASRGHADIEYVHALRRLALDDVDCGDKYASTHFVALAEQVASRYLAEVDASHVNAILPSMGIRSPVSITFDPVTLGSGMFSRHETLQVLMVRFIDHSGCISVRLVDARSLGMFHDGRSQKMGIERALREHPMHLSLSALQARMVSVFSGDGAVAAGGPCAKHSSSRTCELLWEMVYPGSESKATWTVWDPFHRAHCAFSGALSKMGIIQELYSLGRSMNSNFGVHSGRVLFRSLAEELHEPLHAVDTGSGARKVYELSRVAQNLIKNFRLYMAGLHSKVQLKRAGHGSQSQSSLVAVARRLGSVEVVGFMLLFADIMALRIQPFVSLTERQDDPPWIAQRSFQTMMSDLHEDLDKIDILRKLVFVSSLLLHGFLLDTIVSGCRLSTLAAVGF